ncbi:diguanylate cyclase [Arenimonas alkanexedens]
MRSWHRMAAILASVLALVPAHASDHHPPFLSLERYGLDEGLSQLSVTSIVQDDQGFLWIGTQEGLNRFDGQRFTVQRRQQDVDAGPISSSVETLAHDGQSRLWIGTNDAGLERLDLRSGERLRIGAEQGLSHLTVGKLLLDAEAGAWVGSVRGIDYVDAALASARNLGPELAVVAMVRAGGDAFALDARCGLWQLHRDRIEPIAFTAEGFRACVALQGSSEGLWLATLSGEVALVSPGGQLLKRFDRAEISPPEASLTALLLRPGGELLLGHDDGSVIQLDVRGDIGARRLAFEPDIGGAIQVLSQDRDGVLWIGTHTRGLFRGRPLSAAIRRDLASADDLGAWPVQSVRSIWRQSGVELIGTDAGLAWRTAPDAPWRAVPELGNTSIRAIAADAKGGWWLGTHRGLWRMDAQGQATPQSPLPDPRVTDLLVEGDDVWIATRGGLARLRDGVLTTAGVPPELDGEFLTSLMRDSRGRLWIGSNERGLYRLWPDGELEHLWPGNGRLPQNSIWALHASTDAYWIGTFAGGLLRMARDDDAVRSYTSADGLSNDVIYRILPDRRGRLWLSTNNGLNVLDPASDVIQSLGPGDGLRNREYNSGAGLVDANGQLFLGGTEGLDVVDPEQLGLASPPAIPVVSGLHVIGMRRGGVPAQDDRRFDTLYADRVQMDPRDAVLALDLVAIDFSAPDAARLRYRIGGIHQDWVQTRGPQAEVVLSHLAPGDYPLELAAAGRDGRFGLVRTLVIAVPPPAWRHPLAYLAYGLFGCLLLGWGYSRIGARSRERERQIVLLNRTVAERTAELERANHQLKANNRELEVATRTDPLTHVSNRRDLQQWLAREGLQIVREAASAGDERGGIVFFMIDIDNFKHVNDSHGHSVGDEVLVAFAARLSSLSRGHDVVVRWGGEEFLWMLRELHMHDAPAVAERIRRVIVDQPFVLPSGLSLSITCSIGFAPWPFSARHAVVGDWEQSVALADRALYAAKAAGKNAWVGLAPGPALGPVGLESLLLGRPPDAMESGSVRVLHSTPTAPRFPQR